MVATTRVGLYEKLIEARPDETPWRLSYTDGDSSSWVLVFAETKDEATELWHELTDEDGDAILDRVTAL